MNESINPLFIAGIVSFLWKPYTQKAHRNPEQPRDAPWPCPGAEDASCFQMYSCFSNVPGRVWPPACRLLFCHKGELFPSLGCEHGSPAVPPVTAELRPRSLRRTKASLRATARLGPWHGDAWARRAANDYFSCYFKPLVYNQNVFLPKTYSKAAARPTTFTQVPLLLLRSAQCLPPHRSPAAWQPDLRDQEPRKTQPELSQ